MYTRSKYIWIINLVLFIAVVFLGIEQAGRGADISSLENKLDKVLVAKRELSEKIFNLGSEDKTLSASELGFAKPSKVIYFDSIEAVASR